MHNLANIDIVEITLRIGGFQNNAVDEAFLIARFLV